MPLLMEKVRDYWDPQKPKPVETAPATYDVPTDGSDIGDGNPEPTTN
jgi:hypothetical protein